MRELLKYAAGLALAVLLLAWVFRGTDLSAVGRELWNASPGAIVACAALNLGHNSFRVWRWKALLEPFRRNVRFRTAFAAVIVGYMTTWTVPGRLGEVVRPLVLSGRELVPLGPCLGTVVADRLLDAGAVAALFALGAWITPLQGRAAEHAELLRRGSLVLVATVSVGIAAMLAVSHARGRLERWLAGRSSALRWLGRAAVALALGAEALRRPRLAVAIVAHSFGAWVMIAVSTWFGVRAVGIEIPLGAILVILPMLALGVAVPTPGGAGGYHGAMKVGLESFGVAEPLAVSAALLVHALITLPVILTGVVLVRTERLSWRGLLTSASELRHLGGPAGWPAGRRRAS